MEQLLTTKLFIPTARPDLVSRPHLIEQLNAGLHRKLTLISAPAGFGKTTLVSEWVADCGRPAAWLSLDRDDNDPNRFLDYMVAALQKVVPNIGEGIMGTIQSPQPLGEAVLTALLNEITALSQDLIFILDDYYLIDANAIDEAFAFLVENLPPQLHIVIVTRENPSLPLARYRARGQMTELRAADLRFSPAEAAEFLNSVMRLDLSADGIAALEKSTEGWIAGLQMAALSMQGRADTASFIRAFTGSHHFVLDYLVEEVLQRQPEDVRNFLLDTAILEHLCGPLCDAVTGGAGGKEMLAALERGNLFVVPLDEVRQWYRYHHLFADVLLAYSQEERPERLANLHQRASQWYEQNDLLSNAIRHALVTEDFERTANLLELAFPAMESRIQTVTWLKWVQALPEELIHTRPVLSVNYAGALLDSGTLEGVEAWLGSAERLLAQTGELGWDPAEEMVVVDEKQFRSLPARIALARAHIAQIQGDYASAVNYAELVLDRMPDDEQHMRGTVPGVLALAYWANGNLEAAKQAFIDFGKNMQSDGSPFFIIASSGYLAEIIVEQGRLQEALRTYQEALRLAAEQGSHSQQVTAHLYLGLALLYLEMGDATAATQNLDRSRQLGEQMTLMDWPHRWHLAQSRFMAAEGDLEAALEMLDEAERLYVPNPVPDFRPITAQKARVYIKQGKLAMVQAWVQERGLSVYDQMNYLQEYEHITLSRLCIAEFQGQQSERSIRETMEFLERLLDAAETGKRLGSIIEILMLQALACQAQGDLPLALERLGRALALAEPEGYLRIFVDEGPPIASLLREAVKRGMAQNYINQLQRAFRGVERTSSGPPLVEPLSKRELEVLRLLRTELSGPEIASHLMISLSTMRTHTRNIYSKLGVNNRRSAVRRAKEIELL